MIQGCRYLRRSTDRCLLSKNSTTRLKDSKFGTGPVLLCNCSIPITNTKGLYLYPCPNTTPGRLRVQHSLPKLMSRRQCTSRTRHQFVPSLYPSHVITYSRMLHSSSANSPSAEWWRTTDRKHLYRILWGEFPAERRFFTKLGPQVSPFPVPIFGVNICPFNYEIKSDFIPELTINAQRLRAKSIQHPFFPLANRWSLRSDPNPSSSILWAQIFEWRTKTKFLR
jgi:hypothetical protein